LGARVGVHLRSWAVASESAGMMVEDVEGVLKVEGVSSAAACSLLLLGVLFSSPSSTAADAACTSCSTIGWARTSTLRQGLLTARGCSVGSRRGCEPGRCSSAVVALAAISHAPWLGLAPGASGLASRWRALCVAIWFGGPPPHPVRLERPGCDCARARAARCGERAWTRCRGWPQFPRSAT
jgi:hypothetical protein